MKRRTFIQSIAGLFGLGAGGGAVATVATGKEAAHVPQEISKAEFERLRDALPKMTIPQDAQYGAFLEYGKPPVTEHYCYGEDKYYYKGTSR